MVRSKHAGHSPKNLEYWSLYGTYVGKMTATKQHTAPWEKSTPNISLKIKSPLSPQVHTADVSRDLRRHMDKLARLAII